MSIPTAAFVETLNPAKKTVPGQVAKKFVCGDRCSETAGAAHGEAIQVNWPTAGQPVDTNTVRGGLPKAQRGAETARRGLRRAEAHAETDPPTTLSKEFFDSLKTFVKP